MLSPLLVPLLKHAWGVWQYHCFSWHYLLFFC